MESRRSFGNCGGGVQRPECPKSSSPQQVVRSTPHRCAVAIPVRNEAQRLPACLAALASQQDTAGLQFARDDFCVVIFANNCTDGSAALARSMAERLPFMLHVVEAILPARIADAGNARRAAMDLAETWLTEDRAYDGLILTTDADSQVPPCWITNNLAAINAGADAVLGCLALDEEGDHLPKALHLRGRHESAYEALLTELSALLDPLDHNPWPHHATISGASLGVTRPMYLRIGRLPRVPLGEDKALVAELLRHDAKIRFCSNIRVITSARIEGRAPGGVADTLRLRSTDPDACCDEALEPFRVAMRRALWRGRLRRLRLGGGLAKDTRWVGELAIPSPQVRSICRSPTFGTMWSAIESVSPVLIRRPLSPAELPRQILGARRAVARLRTKLAPPHDVYTDAVATLLAPDVHRSVHAFGKEMSRVIAGQRIVGLARPKNENDIAFEGERERQPRGEMNDVC
jgi:Glycosyl transferase family 2